MLSTDQLSINSSTSLRGQLSTESSTPLSSQLTVLIGLWIRNYSTRRTLGELDDRILDDIGIDRIAAEQEVKKPFWRN